MKEWIGERQKKKPQKHKIQIKAKNPPYSKNWDADCFPGLVYKPCGPYAGEGAVRLGQNKMSGEGHGQEQ